MGVGVAGAPGSRSRRLTCTMRLCAVASASQVILKRTGYEFDFTSSPRLERLVCWVLWPLFPPVPPSLRKLELLFDHSDDMDFEPEMDFDLAGLTHLEELALRLACTSENDHDALNAVSALTGLRSLTLDLCGPLDVKTVFTGLTSLTRLSLNVSNSSRESFVPTLPASAPLRELKVTFQDMIGYYEMSDTRVKVRLLAAGSNDYEEEGDAGEDHRETLDVSPFAGTLERLTLGCMDLGPGLRGLLRGNSFPRLRSLDLRASTVSCPGWEVETWLAGPGITITV